MANEHDDHRDGKPGSSIVPSANDSRLECMFWLIGLVGVIAAIAVMAAGH